MDDSLRNRKRWLKMAECHDAMVPYLVPHYNWLQEEALHFTGAMEREAAAVVDLAAGSGLFIEKLLAGNGTAKAVWIDSSEAFLEVAKRRLARFDGRVSYLRCRLEDDWETALEIAPSHIFSMCAIHHLTHEEKRDVYGRAFKTLANDGWFCNIDEAIPYSQGAYIRAMDFWVRHVDLAKDRVSEESRLWRDEWLGHFEKWKIRNLDMHDRPKEKGDDMHAPFLEQLSWLEEAGFHDVDAHVKYHLWSIMGGRKRA